MSEFKFTPGPWHVGEGPQAQIVYDKDGWGVASATVFHRKHEPGSTLHNAKLIAAAPDLFYVLKATVDNAEQRAFEDWLTRTAPGGDCDSVHSQWIESSDCSDFASDWDLQLTAIAKATA